MATTLLVKSLRGLITLWIVVSAVFFALRATGDPTTMLLPDDTPTDIVEMYRQKWGFDQPIPVQYFTFLGDVLRGHLGVSFVDGRSAIKVVFERLPSTLLLGATSFLTAIVFGVSIGVIAAVYHRKVVDRLISALLAVVHAMPNFLVGLLLMLLFSVALRWLPSSGYGTHWHLLLPTMTLGLWGGATIARVTRAAMIEVLKEPYIDATRARGFTLFHRVVREALPNAAVPIITILGLNAGQLFAGAVITETIFAWPGIGRLLVTAAASREVAIVQVILIVVSAIIVSINLIADVLCVIVNPALRKR
ncbi:ABC transporter permease subunit [Rhizobium laguerreae]|uniref:ABC transporter permease n=1 Tax=Rhizobium TaxID=379 RepID=UPI0004820810|nr:ABC transporter permease [Rhizobium leguminosarum]NKM21967.1 ABC transporter permease subunit [Rhizobium laguerreae]